MRFTKTEGNIVERAEDYALRIVRMFGRLPKSVEVQVIGKQTLRSGTSVGAHITEANRARSTADFTNKLDGALQEVDETGYWLRLLVRAGVVEARKLDPLLQETAELSAIITTIANKSRRKTVT